MNRPNVTLYTGPACPYCLIIKRLLETSGVAYLLVDISKDRAARAELVQLTGQSGVPVVKVGQEVVVGYNVRRLKKALGIR